MTYSIRHAGSPQSVTGQSLADVLAGLSDGDWEPMDEVRSEAGGVWLPLETHPDFASAVADYEPVPRSEPEDETRLDMNPLIDVSLVLLIFFILTATYETIRKVLDMPGATAAKVTAGVAKGKGIIDFVIRVTARTEASGTVIKVEDEVVTQENLLAKMQTFTRSTGKRQVLLDAEGVEWGAVVAIMDAARAAGIEKTLLKTPVER